MLSVIRVDPRRLSAHPLRRHLLPGAPRTRVRRDRPRPAPHRHRHSSRSIGEDLSRNPVRRRASLSRNPHCDLPEVPNVAESPRCPPCQTSHQQSTRQVLPRNFQVPFEGNVPHPLFGDQDTLLTFRLPHLHLPCIPTTKTVGCGALFIARRC